MYPKHVLKNGGGLETTNMQNDTVGDYHGTNKSKWCST